MAEEIHPESTAWYKFARMGLLHEHTLLCPTGVLLASQQSVNTVLTPCSELAGAICKSKGCKARATEFSEQHCSLRRMNTHFVELVKRAHHSSKC
jgi:invasion protein IalB